MGFQQIVQGCKLITEIQPSLYLFRLFSATIVTSQNSLDNRSKSILANHLRSGEVDLAESGRPDHSGTLMERDNISWNIMSKGSGIQWDSMGFNGDGMQNAVGLCANVSKALWQRGPNASSSFSDEISSIGKNSEQTQIPAFSRSHGSENHDC